jgi:hypothetical protein
MPRYRLPKGAVNVEMSDGSMLTGRGSARTGIVVDVDDSSHARAFERQAKGDDFIIKQGLVAPTGGGERRCENCNRSWWPWQTKCGKCGQPTTEVAA